jgi:hypothetical protein
LPQQAWAYGRQSPPRGGRPFVGIAGNCHKGCCPKALEFAELPYQFISVHVRQSDVTQDDVGRPGSHDSERLGGTVGDPRFMAGQLEVQCNTLAQETYLVAVRRDALKEAGATDDRRALRHFADPRCREAPSQPLWAICTVSPAAPGCWGAFPADALMNPQSRRCVDFVKTASPIGLRKYRARPVRC